MTEQALDDDERAELDRLRTERAGRTGRPARVGRWVASVLVLVVTALLAIVAVGVVIARDELLDTERYLSTVAPLAEDPAIRKAVSERLTEAVNERLAVSDLVQNAVASVRTQGGPDSLEALTGPITSAVEGFVADQVEAIVYSDRFTQLWTAVNEVAHREIATLLRGGDADKLSVKDGVLYLDLQPVVAEVKDRLVAKGLTAAQKLPEVSVTYPLMDVSGLVKLRGLASLLDTLAWVLPLVVAVAVAVAVWLAPNRRRGLAAAALFLAGGMAVLLGAIALTRAIVLTDLPPTVKSPSAAAAAFDITVRLLIEAAQTLLVLTLIAAVVVWLSGPGRGATVIRDGSRRLCDAAAAGLRRTGVKWDSLSRFVSRNRRAIEVGVVLLGLLWLVLWQHRGVAGVLWVAAVALVVVAVVEVLGRLTPEPEPRPRS